MKTTLAILIGLILTGCASSTGVVPTGEDSYMISIKGGYGNHNSGGLKADEYRDANEYCKKQGKKMQPVGTNESDGIPGVMAKAELDFMCLDPNDPQLTRVRMEPVAPRAPSSN